MDMASSIPYQSMVSSLCQAGTQQTLRLLDVAQGVHHQVQQVIPIFRACVADSLLGLRPDILFRVEFRSVGWEAFQMQPPMAVAKLNYFPIPMNRAAVQQHDDLSAQVSQQLGKVLHYLHRSHIPRINLKVESQLLARWRHAQASNNRETLAAIAVPQHRRAAHRRPSAQHRRNEHEPAFIEEHQMSAQPPCFFLYAASRAASIAGFSWGCVEWPGVRASGNSSPGRSEFSRRAPDGSLCPNAVGFARRPAGWSTSLWSSRPRTLPALASRSTPASADLTFPADGPASGGASSQPCPCAGSFASSAPTNLWMTEPRGPQLDRSGLASKAQPPWCAAPVIVGQSLRVSRTQLYHSLSNISIIYAKLNST